LDEAEGWPEASAYLQDTWEGPVHVRAGGRGSYTGATDELLWSPRAGISVPLPTGTVPKISGGLYHKTPTDPRILDDVIGNPDIGSEKAIHAVVGLDQGFPLPGESAGGLIRVEAYHIALSDLVVHPDDPDAITNGGDSWSNEGTGTNRGVDVLVGARSGRLGGMLTYSLLVAERTNPLATVYAETYAPGQDQRHTLGASTEWQVTPDWRGTLRYSFHTGRPISTVVASGEDKAALSCVNCDRLGNYHNIDVRGEWRRALESYRLAVYLEILNVTNFQSDFVPTVQVENGELTEGMFSHLPIRPFLGVRADF